MFERSRRLCRSAIFLPRGPRGLMSNFSFSSPPFLPFGQPGTPLSMRGLFFAPNRFFSAVCSPLLFAGGPSAPISPSLTPPSRERVGANDFESAAASFFWNFLSNRPLRFPVPLFSFLHFLAILIFPLSLSPLLF